MWNSVCVYCKKIIKDREPCYPIYSDGEKRYRHINCFPDYKDKEPVPFGNVLDLTGELD